MSVKKEKYAEQTATSCNLAKAWYIKYPGDFYALGPLRYDDHVPANTAAEQGKAMSGEYPSEIWATGPVIEVDEYHYPVFDLVEC